MLEPGKAAKTDKASIITDAIRIVTQLRAENGQLRQLNKFLEVYHFWPPAQLLDINNFHSAISPCCIALLNPENSLPRAWARSGMAMCLSTDVLGGFCGIIDLVSWVWMYGEGPAPDIAVPVCRSALAQLKSRRTT